MAYLFMTSNCSTNSVSICENYSYILPFLGVVCCECLEVYMFINACNSIEKFSLCCRLGSGLLKRIPSFLQGWIQLLLGNGKGISL